MDLADFESRAVEPLAEIRAILPHEIARRRDQADIAAGAQRFGDRDAHHDFRFTGAGWSFEQELELAAFESAGDRGDRHILVVGEGEGLAGLDELTGFGDRLGIGFDALPHEGGFI